MAFHLITLDPGHFHASLVQKFMYADVDPRVHVYSPGGDVLEQHLARIERFNTRADDPTHWRQEIYTGPDYFDKMLAEKAGNVVVFSGRNAGKAELILRCAAAGLHVLADKPMIITPAELPTLQRAFEVAAEKRVLLYDIMTERHEITTILQRELSQMPELFGQLVAGTPQEPAISKQSVHHYSKIVAGAPLKRPAWFFDIHQQGEGIVDITTHLVDMIQWEAFPGQTLNPSDVTVLNARRWTTPITPEQFTLVTGLSEYPDDLASDVHDGVLQVYCNGEMNYRLRDVHAKVSVTWEFQAPPGAGDTHFSAMRGSRAQLIIRQGKEQAYKPILYVAKSDDSDQISFEARLNKSIQFLLPRYPGIGVERRAAEWVITVPKKYDIGHEAHFAQVMENFLSYLRAGRMPEWEVPNMLAKYATIMRAYEMSR